MKKALLAVIVLLAAHGVSAQMRPAPGTLRVIVLDPSGAVIPGAAVRISAADAAAVTDAVSDAQGIASVRDLTPGRYTIEVSVPGFETKTLRDVRVRSGDNRREVALAIERVSQSVSVGRDPATAASDPNSDRFGNVLSPEQIAALPDDPDEMEQVLRQMAGPGGTIRVDGFRGGKLPPKSQIRSIRFASGMFAAENHGGGVTFVDIATQPGLGPLRGGTDVTFRSGALNARNAFQPRKGPEQTQQYAFNLSGTLMKGRTSFALSAGGASLYDSAYVYAALPGGGRTAPIRRPTDRLNFNGRLDHALTKTHTLRATFQQNGNDQHTLGVGGYDLADRAYARTSRDSVLRLAESGPWSHSVFAESRLQLHWTSTDARSAFESPTVKVLDAFTAGGAQQAGGRDSTELEWAANVDWTKKKHAVRFGALVEGGQYRSDTRTNYLGTFTFSSLADFDAGQPATYTRRLGDPLVRYQQWQAGFFVQDDWRVRKNLTLSGGLRHELQTHVGDHANLAPRAGFTWSPFKSGKTTIRGGGGIFYDWLDADTYEQTLRVDGTHQQDLIVLDPGFPDPVRDGVSEDVLPSSRYQLAPGLTMPARTLVLAGLTHQISQRLTFNLMYTHSNASNRLRGRNVNAPDAGGVRPDPSLGNVTQVESTSRARGDSVNVGLNFNIPQKRTFIFANYSWIDQRNDADGAFSLPADSYNPRADWGPAYGVPHHLFNAMANTSLPKNFRLGASFSARTGTPYNITTGRDDNRDTVFTDRPAGVGRNRATTAGQWEAGARLGYTFGFGERRDPAGPGGMPPQIIMRVGPGAGAAGDMLGALGGGGADNKRIRIELYASAQNLFNTVNPIGYSGVMTSPFFRQPTAAGPARKIDFGTRVSF